MRVELEQLSALGQSAEFYHPLIDMVQVCTFYLSVYGTCFVYSHVLDRCWILYVSNIVQEMLSWIYKQEKFLEKQDFEHYSSW